MCSLCLRRVVSELDKRRTYNTYAALRCADSAPVRVSRHEVVVSHGVLGSVGQHNVEDALCAMRCVSVLFFGTHSIQVHEHTRTSSCGRSVHDAIRVRV